jgi:hypothetical protein
LQQAAQNKGNGGNKTGKNGKNDNKRKCFECGSPDHIKPNCPKLNKSNGDKKTDDKSGEKSKLTRYTTPKDGEPLIKDIDGVQHKYCATCKRWNNGAKAHTTDEHVVGKKPPAEQMGALGEATGQPIIALTQERQGYLSVVQEEAQSQLRTTCGYLGSMGMSVPLRKLKHCELCGWHHASGDHKSSPRHVAKVSEQVAEYVAPCLKGKAGRN